MYAGEVFENLLLTNRIARFTDIFLPLANLPLPVTILLIFQPIQPTLHLRFRIAEGNVGRLDEFNHRAAEHLQCFDRFNSGRIAHDAISTLLEILLDQIRLLRQKGYVLS